MGYYVKVEPNVKLYVEDLNPEGKKTILFIIFSKCIGYKNNN
ncbi:non-heme haloperoxidase family protein [Clostridium botulinum A3 str. Loch Maree]|nr:non-heme haloperoxidase family protein [Clostridium botulinum A3 str. Loch Maree]